MTPSRGGDEGEPPRRGGGKGGEGSACEQKSCMLNTVTHGKEGVIRSQSVITTAGEPLVGTTAVLHS